MRKVMSLVNVQLWAALGEMLSIGKSGKKKQGVLYAGVLFFVLLMSAVSFFYSFMIGTGLKMFNSLDILPAMMLSVTCIITLMTTIFKVKGTIFGFRDYDLIMSLPVSTGAVVACRLIILYAFNILFVIIMMVPMMAAYGILSMPDIRFYLIGFVLIFIIPLIPIIAASVLGTIIAYVASKFRHNNLLNIILSVGLLAVFIGLPFTFRGSGQELVNISKALTDQVNRIYPLAGMYTKAVIDYDMKAFLLFLFISAAAFLLYTIVVKMLFKKINTMIMTGRFRTNFKLGEIRTSSPFKALYFKELKRYFASTIYVLNTGIGIVLLTLGAVASIFVDLDKVLGGAEAVGLLKNNVILYITFCIVLTSTTMASISLEGKNLWIVKSLPVTPKTVFFSKIAVNLTITAPAVLDTFIIGAVFRLGIVKILSMLLITVACAFFTSFYGLLINLLIPNFNWTAEVMVVKQSAASMITIFSCIGYVGVLFLCIFVIPSTTIAYLVYFLLTVILDAVLFAVLMTYGKKRFYSL